ncbi:MAG: hypothetical protein RR244_02440 [Oscillospiraceae bacterium]
MDTPLRAGFYVSVVFIICLTIKNGAAMQSSAFSDYSRVRFLGVCAKGFVQFKYTITDLQNAEIKQ